MTPGIQEVEELCKKLKPIYGKKAENLWLAYLAEDAKGKQEVELMIRLLANQQINDPVKEDAIILRPPALAVARGEYPLGTVMYRNKGFGAFGLREDEWIQHLAIFGRSGSGKTNVAFIIILDFLRKHKPFVVFDWKRNYRDLLLSPDAVPVLLFSVGNEDVSPFRWNPLVPPPGTAPIIWLKKLVEIVSHAYFLGEGVMYLLHNLIDSAYRDFGVYQGGGKFPQMKDLLSRLQQMELKGRQSLWYDSTLRALFSLCFGYLGDVLNTDSGMDVAGLLEKQVIMELDALTASDKIFFIEALLLWIHHYRMAQGGREVFKHAIIMEEAHHILLRKKQEAKGEETITDVILREIREFGESVILIDQHPSLISPTALGNTNCTITMNLKHRADVNLAADAMLMDFDNREMLGLLPIGSAIVKLQTRYLYPFLVAFPRMSIKKGLVSNEQIRARMTGYSVISKPNNEEANDSPPIPAVPRHDIEGSEKTGTAASDQDVRFLKDVYEWAISGVVKRYERLGLSKRKGTEIQQLLEGRGLIKAVDVNTGKSRIKLLDLTPAGVAVLKDNGVEVRINPRLGGVEHRYWIWKLKKELRARGYKVWEEYPLPDGGFVDLVFERDGEKIGIEVETGSSNVGMNVAKCRKAFSDFFVFSTNVAAETKVDFGHQIGPGLIDLIFRTDFL